MQIVRLEKIYSNKGIWPPKNLNFMQELKEIFSNFSSMFLNPNKFFKLDYNQSYLLLQTLGKTQALHLFIYRQCGQAYEVVTLVVTLVVTSAYFEPKNQNKFHGFQKRYYATFQCKCFFCFDHEKLKKLPSKVEYFNFCLALSVLQKITRMYISAFVVLQAFRPRCTQTAYSFYFNQIFSTDPILYKTLNLQLLCP